MLRGIAKRKHSKSEGRYEKDENKMPIERREKLDMEEIYFISSNSS